MFVGGWALQILGHRIFEKNMPSTSKGWITYQLTGIIQVCEEYGEMLARRSQRGAARQRGGARSGKATPPVTAPAAHAGPTI
jgi:hypothetical protein